MKKLFLCTFLFLLLHPAFATSIVILITPDYILLGTDSRRMLIDHEKNENVYSSACKIRSLGKYCYAMAGLIASEESGFSADSIVARNLNKTKNYSKARGQIIKQIRHSLQQELKGDNCNSALMQDIAASGEPVLELAILRLEDKKPHVEIIGFRVADNKTLHIISYTTTKSLPQNKQQNKMYLLGQYSGMEAFLKESNTDDPVLLINQMITVQSKTTPTSVAQPINIIRYSAHGVEWIQ